MDFRRLHTLKHLREGRLIARNPEIHSGAYTVRGTRLTVRFLKGRHRGGDSIAFIAKDYGLSREVVRAVINWRLVEEEKK